MPIRPAFVNPCLPVLSQTPPKGPNWVHQAKWDGYRSRVRLFSKRGTEWTRRLSALAEAFAELPAQAVVLDGELVFGGADGRPRFYQLMAQMRTKWPDETALMFMAFDFLHADGVDLRPLPLSERNRDLVRLCRNVTIPCMSLVETFPEGALLLEWCGTYGLEGIVSKRVDKPYVSGASKWWVKCKCPEWRRANAERWRQA